MDLNRYKLDNTYVRAILLLWADGVPWPSGARDRVPGAPTQARFSQLGPRHSVADGHAVLPVSARIGLSSGRYKCMAFVILYIIYYCKINYVVFRQNKQNHH